ncbi:MAG: response regulator, partial [Archangium sp.]|nr:response regulator [Archangium sp.]
PAVPHPATSLPAPAAAPAPSPRTGTLRRLGQYALGARATEKAQEFQRGEGLLGQAALDTEMVVVTNPPASYLQIRSGLGEAAPRELLFVPLVLAGQVTGVLEIALFTPSTPLQRQLLSSVRESLAIAMEVARARDETKVLLRETQEQAAQLAAQEEELRATNEELQAQQTELRQSNEELARQTEELEAQRRALQANNTELDEARRTLEQKAAELTTVSAYKSQFLTNMSHELRTPLNSMLLLSNLLSENDEKNLTEKQVEYSKTIYSAGRDLLALINQVLDLAKVESGKQVVRFEKVALAALVDRARRVFEPLAKDKKLGFSVQLAPGLPAELVTDHQRVEQVLTNLLGNALKFTEHGSVTLRIDRPPPGAKFHRATLAPASAVAFSVTDTGPGIAPENQEAIFVPFEQLDAAPDRKYGGTGLGLTIAKELAGLLGGELTLTSALGQGSTFTVTLPEEPPVDTSPETLRLTPSKEKAAPQPATTATDDRAALGASEPYLLIIEDDLIFSRAFGEVIHDQGLKFISAPDGATGLAQAKERPPSGVILDVKLPDIDGFQVMAELHADPRMAQVPVHFVSAVDGSKRGLAMGAVGYLTKPATRRDLARVVETLVPSLTEVPIRLLVVEDDAVVGNSLMKQLTDEGLEARRVRSAGEALAALAEERYRCMVLDLSLPDMDGLELLQAVREKCGAEMPSVVIYTARALSKAEANRLEAYTEAIVLKEGSSSERLINEIRLFVRRLREGLQPRQRALAPVPLDVRLEGHKLLIVDDDMRTVYALSATLRSKGAVVYVADTGKAGLEALAAHADIEAVLMDIMMPEMDGYEAMRRIRAQPRYAALPIVALTAKAMKGDAEKCIEAGASDYLPKPIDAERLLALLHTRLSGKANGAA